MQRCKRIFRRDFSDGRHGGREPALQAALVYREALIQAHPPLSKPVYCAMRKQNNRSGISGLTRTDIWALSKGRLVRRLFWEAQWPSGKGKSQHKKFSILKYGEEDAYQKALAAREPALHALSSLNFCPVKGGCRTGA